MPMKPDVTNLTVFTPETYASPTAKVNNFPVVTPYSYDAIGFTIKVAKYIPMSELATTFMPVTQKLKVLVENHKLPKFITLFRNSICVKPTINKLETDADMAPADLTATTLLATTTAAVNPTDDIKKRGGSEVHIKGLSSHSWLV